MGCCLAKKVYPNSPEWKDSKWSWKKLKRRWKTLKAGDMVLVSYRDGSANRIVGALQNSHWDHVGLVVHGFDRSSWVAESSDHPLVIDCEDCRGQGPHLLEASRSGVHIYRLFERITDPDAYKFHRVAYSVRRLKGVRRNKTFYKVVEKLVQDSLGVPYSKLIDLLRTGFRCHDGGMRRTCMNQTMHCSQLAALLYQRLGLIPSDYESNNFMPADFSSESNGEYKVDFLMAKNTNAKLTKEELIFYEGQNEAHDRSRAAIHNARLRKLDTSYRNILAPKKAKYKSKSKDEPGIQDSFRISRLEHTF